jgi:hypothetical protein
VQPKQNSGCRLPKQGTLLIKVKGTADQWNDVCNRAYVLKFIITLYAAQATGVVNLELAPALLLFQKV